MEYQDRIVIATPEGLQLEYALAGPGSRFIVWLGDVVLRLLVFAALIVVCLVIGDATLTDVVLILGTFVSLFAYDVVFEVWGAGQTPVKRRAGLRVLMAGGQPIGLASSAVRTLLRLVDGPATLFVAGAACVLMTERNQRLGDLAAGTIVVRERRVAPLGEPAALRLRPAPDGFDATAITASELAAVREFLARREGLTPAARDRVAGQLAGRLAPKIGGTGELPSAEAMLEAIAAAKSASR
jgi:uncharacterized RDD family membrane protein YckC